MRYTRLGFHGASGREVQVCGFVGLVGGEAENAERQAIVTRAGRVLAHRGPDEFSVCVTDHFAFAHQRLVILDREGGRQPWVSSDGRFTLVYNGEIYNLPELRADLLARGLSLRSRSDTEIIVEGFRVWGELVLPRLNGMFAFALWDAQTKTLFAARDSYGQKPFYYFRSGQTFAFASEVSALESLPGFSKTVPRQQVVNYLAFESFGNTGSVYQGVSKLEPGTFLRWSAGEVSTAKYLREEVADALPTDSTQGLGSQAGRAELREQADGLIRQAVQRCWAADVPLTLLLSGGLDSSLVAAVLRDLFPDRDLTAFHAGVTEPSYGETLYARQVARLLRLRMQEVRLDRRMLAAAARELIARWDEPQADAGSFAKYALLREVGREFKGALTGDGGDEFFFGYETFKAFKLGNTLERFPRFLFPAVFAATRRLLPPAYGYLPVQFKLQRFAQGFARPRHLRNAAWTEAVSALAAHKIFQPPWYPEYEKRDAALELLYAGYPVKSALQALAREYQQSFLPNQVLASADRASMLNSVELRAPLLDSGVTGFANQLSAEAKMPGWVLKGLLKAVAEKYLPRGLIYRRKQGFSAPIAQLLRHELRDELVELANCEYVRAAGVFEISALGAWVEEHVSGRANRYKELWAFFTLFSWLRAKNLSLS